MGPMKSPGLEGSCFTCFFPSVSRPNHYEVACRILPQASMGDWPSANQVFWNHGLAFVEPSPVQTILVLQVKGVENGTGGLLTHYV